MVLSMRKSNVLVEEAAQECPFVAEVLLSGSSQRGTTLT